MKVSVYYNLHKKLWSVKALEGPQKGRVITRSWYVTLLDAKPRVSQAGRNRVLREKRKNVHAGLVGTLCETSLPRPQTDSKLISYNPYKCGNFYYRQEPEKEYTGSDYAQLVINLDNKPAVFTSNQKRVTA